MNTPRRSFLRALGAGTVGLAVDSELLAWQPGARAFFDLYEARRKGWLHRQYLKGRLYGWGFNWYRDGSVLSRCVGQQVLDTIPNIHAGRSGHAIATLEKQAHLLAAVDGVMLTEEMPLAEFKRRYGF